MSPNAEDRSNSTAYQRLRTVRRVLVASLVLLILLLVAASFFLLRAFEPVGTVATSAQAKGIEWVRSIYGSGNDPDQQLSSPQAVAVAPDGTIWVTDAGRKRLLSFKPDGTFSSVLEKGTKGGPGAFSFPSSVAVDEQGLIYVGDTTASEVDVMRSDGSIVATIPVPRPQSVAVRGEHLVVGANAGFVIMSKTGEVVKVIGTPGQGDEQFNNVAGIAIGADGTIYVVDQYNNRVSAYDETGKRLWIVKTGMPGNQTTPQASMNPTTTVVGAGMQLPSGITIDGAGRLAVVDPFGFNIVLLNARDGSKLASYGDAGAEDGTFVYPSGIAYDPQRDWFVIADTSMDRVQIVRMPGSGASGVGAVTSSVNRTLLGPARACVLPLAVLLLFAIVATVMRVRRRRGARGDGAEVGALDRDAAPETAES